MAMVGTESNGVESSASEGLFDGWPGWTKPVFVLAVMVLWVGAPMAAIGGTYDSGTQSGGAANYQPMIAVLIALTTATIAAIFLFMTFRIDRGTRLTAARHAKKATEDFLRQKTEAIKDSLRQKTEAIEDSLHQKTEAIENSLHQKTEELTRAVTREEVTVRLTDKMLREQVKAVLMVDANGRIVDECVRQPIENLDAKTVEEVIDRLSTAIETWARHVEKTRQGGHAGWWAKVKARFAGSRQ